MYNHKGTIHLETDRLILRKFTLSDAEAMFHTWASDKDVPRYMRWDAHKTVDETKEVISAWLKNYGKIDFYLWALTIKETDAPIGTLGMFCVN